MIEIYDKDSILFMTPLSRQDEFYVEETEEEEDERVNSTLEESEKEGYWDLKFKFKIEQ